MIEIKTTQDIFEEYTQQALDADEEWVEVNSLKDFIRKSRELADTSTEHILLDSFEKELGNGT